MAQTVSEELADQADAVATRILEDYAGMMIGHDKTELATDQLRIRIRRAILAFVCGEGHLEPGGDCLKEHMVGTYSWGGVHNGKPAVLLSYSGGASLWSFDTRWRRVKKFRSAIDGRRFLGDYPTATEL